MAQENLGKRLETIIKIRGLSKVQFANKIGGSKEYITRLTSGKKKMNETFAKRAASVLDVSVDYLLGLTDVPAPEKNDSADKKIISKEMVTWNKQQYLLLEFQELLERIGVKIIPLIQFGKDVYEYQSKDWVGTAGRINDEDMYELIRSKKRKPVKYGVYLTLDGDNNRQYFDYYSFLDWQQTIINKLGNLIRKDLKGLQNPILQETIADNYQRAIEGKSKISW